MQTSENESPKSPSEHWKGLTNYTY